MTDLRRDVAAWKRWFVWFTTKPKDMRPGLVSSLNAAYTKDEIAAVLAGTKLSAAEIKADFFDLCISGTKKASLKAVHPPLERRKEENVHAI